MIPQLLWVCSLLVAGMLALRAMQQGGPIADWIWMLAGAASLMVFGGELWAAAPKLFAAISAETIMDPNPIIRTHTAVCVAIVFFRPSRRPPDRAVPQ